MPYLNTTTASFGHSVYDVRAAYPGASIPNGVSFGNFEWYAPSTPAFDGRTQAVTEIGIYIETDH